MIKYSRLLFSLLLSLPGFVFANAANTTLSLVLPSRAAINEKMSANVAAKPSDNSGKAPFTLKNIIYLGDSYEDDGNYEAITGFPPEYDSNGPPWSTDVNLGLGLPAVGRWTAAGSPPNKLGNNYAVSGAAIEGGSLTAVDTSLQGQINLLLSDYPKGIPADTLVVVAIGTNDVIGAMNVGGIWSINLEGWQLDGPGFTIPAAGSTVTVRVPDTFGLVAGSNNVVAFQNKYALTLFSVAAVDPINSTVTLTNLTGVTGTLVSANARFKMAATYILDLKAPVFAQELSALLNDGANLVLALPWRTDFLPVYNQQPNQTNAYFTWLYLYLKMAAAIPKKGQPIMFYDLNDFFTTVYFDFSQYGFLYNYPAWGGNPNTSANEYVFWDSLHPTGKMHQLIANDFMGFLGQLGLQASKKDAQ
jgi:lysophospholipase L1-like esterase